MEPEAAAPPAYEIRAPREQDASPLAQLHVQVWQQAYRGLLAQGYLDAMQWLGRREERWQTWVSEFAGGCPNADGNCLQLTAATVGDRPAYLWVLSGNNRAIAFYRKMGFELDGVSTDDVHLDCTDLRMVRS